jgi:hypothetical protein
LLVLGCGITPAHRNQRRRQQLRIHRDAAHGLLLQHPAEVVAAVNEFLATDDENVDRAPTQRGGT